MKTNANEPINPSEVQITNNGTKVVQNYLADDTYESSGLTKREHFAAIAMQGWISATNISNVPIHEVDNMPEIAAKWAVKYADALIESLNK